MHWNASPEILTLGPITLRWYSMSFVVGALWMINYVQRRFQAHGRDPQLVNTLTTYFIAGMAIGARLGHCLFYEPAHYLARPWEILMVWEGGLASHGGILGVLAGVLLFCRKHPEVKFLWLMDVLIGPAVICGGLIRIGNLFNSEVYGKVTDVPWAFIFDRVDQLPRHPTQLYEALGYFVIGGWLTWLERRKGQVQREGTLLALMFVTVALFRFAVEFFKVEYPLDVLNIGQLLTLPFFVAGAVLCWKSYRNKGVA